MKPQAQPSLPRAFTLLELMVAMGVLVLILSILVSVTNQTGSLWRQTSSKAEQFRNARQALASIEQRLSQATLNTYWDYERDAPGKITRYIRQSELRFISGPSAIVTAGSTGTTAAKRPTHCTFFQAPLGLTEDPDYRPFSNLLNTWGYFVEFDTYDRPPFITTQIAPPKYRYRLLEMMEPSESLTLYHYTSTFGNDTNPLYVGPSYTGREWLLTPLDGSNGRKRVLADNVIAMVLLPKLSPQEDPSGGALAPDYVYDSSNNTNNPATNPKNQLPPIVQVTLVAIDEHSAMRIADGSASPNLGVNLANLFKDANPVQYAKDLQDLEGALAGKNIKYRVFNTSVTMKGARWSREQAN